MKLSVFTTMSSPAERGDAFSPALRCYADLADDLVVVNGGNTVTVVGLGEHTDVVHPWPKEFSWEFIGRQFQRGYERCLGDWVIHADLDFIFHEDDYAAIRKACDWNPAAPALTFYKKQFTQPDRFQVKSRLALAVNKGRFGDRIRFDSGGDLCQPSLDGEYIDPQSVPDLSIAFWNYEKLLKTEAQIKDDVGRMARAWQRRFDDWHLGGPDDASAYAEWLKMSVGRYYKPHEEIPLEAHPKIMQDTIRNLRPDQWGYDGLGHFPINHYAKGNEG